MEAQQHKSWTVKMQRTADSKPEVVKGDFDTKSEAGRYAMEVWTDSVFKVWIEYE